MRTRLRTAPGAAVALGVLVLLTAFLAAAFPRAVTTYEDEGLRHAIDSAPAGQRVIQATSNASFRSLGDAPEESEPALTPEDMRQGLAEVLKAPAKPLQVLPGQAVHAVLTPTELAATDTWLPKLAPAAMPSFAVTARSGLAGQARFVAGRAPVHQGDKPAGAVLGLEAAVSEATARTLGLTVGSVVHLDAESRGATSGNSARVKISGIFAPRAPQSLYWAVDPNLLKPGIKEEGNPDLEHWWSTLLVAPEAAPSLFHLAPELERVWEVAPRTDHLTAAETSALVQSIASLENGPGASALRARMKQPVTVGTGIEGIVASYESNRTAVAPVISVAGYGVGTVAAVVLLMAGALAGARRYAELSLLRARGGSVRGIAGRLGAELGVVAVPAAVLGWAAAYALLPHAPLAPSLLAAAAVALLASAALPVRAAVSHLRPRVHGGRGDIAHAKPSRRRTVVELTLAVLTVGAVAALRRRGTDDGADALISAAPVLIGIVAALVLVRLYPLPLRWAARPMALRRGAIGFLSAARAGRAPVTAMLPLLALLIALTTAAFGGSVLAGVNESRDRAATVRVGADARLDARGKDVRGYDERAVAAVRKAPGVREVVAVGLDFFLSLPDKKSEITLVAVDPVAYAQLSGGPDAGGFAPAALKGGKRGGTFPVLVSPDAAKRLRGTGDLALRSASHGDFTARVAGTVPRTPVLPEGDFMIVSKDAFASVTARSLLVSGDGLTSDGLTRAAGVPGLVHLWSEERARFVDQPLQAGAMRIYTVSVAAGAGFAVLAVLLSLLQSAPERGALLARLRTMGLSRGQGRKLLVLEALPQALLAAFGGALVGWAAIRLLAPDIDLTALALATSGRTSPTLSAALGADTVSLLVPAVAVVCLAAGVAAVQAWWTTRRTTTTELRAGDAR
ncbi:ABC transporter permease [Streptomyces sp. NBC_00237]|uniref:FtsX-like permease family protein n=1 Tax=Streptomyces sp. NBC_00237 TaxID=2975687 RepID=UPI0022583761|nr:ABC transporter permease [Streptomyces sp. NBC_00237]MCX5201174.1 ABC transporter permease [Streptomyces sp. NBC_00237]